MRKSMYLLFLLPGFFSGCTSTSDLEWNQEEHFRWAEVSTGFFGKTGFKELSPSATNIDFNNQMDESEMGNRHYMNGSGVAAGDIDGDGLIDLYFASLNGPNKLYRNLGGMKFEDITEQAGVAHEGYHSTGVVFADINGNTHLDLLVTSMHRENVLYLNDGTGIFTRSDSSGLGPAKGSMTMALADITGNGYPDLYIVNYMGESIRDLYTTEELELEHILNEPLREPTDIYTLAPPFDRYYELDYQDGEFAGVSEIGERDELYLNRGGTFEKVDDTRGMFLNEDGEPVGLQRDWGLSAKFQDMNGDGLQDLYVCNDFQTPDRIWMNLGNSRFQAIGREAIRNHSFACMGVDFSDINRDGYLDYFTTEMLNPDSRHRKQTGNPGDPNIIRIGDLDARPLYNRNSMFLQREDDTYAEISYLSNTQATGWSWDATFMDIDLNGYEDLLVTTGYLSQVLNIDAQIDMMNRRRDIDDHYDELLLSTPPLELHNRILINNGDLSFTEQGPELGFTDPDISHGMAVADLDNDGALDVVINRMNSPAALYLNTTNNNRIGVRLRGDSPNTLAIGAVIELQGGPVVQQKQISVGGDYLSGSDTMVMFAAGDEEVDHEISVKWPDGRESLITGVRANRIYEISQTGAQDVSTERIADVQQSPMFEDVSDRLGHTHHEEPFVDFQIQPLLPFRKSQSGPGVAWLDITGNGRDDLLIGTGKGGRLSIFENSANNRFEPVYPDLLTRHAPGDQTTILGWSEDGQSMIVTGSANYEQNRLNGASAYLYRVNPDGTVAASDSLPASGSTTGPLAAADVDGNGYLDLFVGGSFVPGRFPVNASSKLFSNEIGLFVPDEAASQQFEDLGLINGAQFSDITGNGRQDLLVSSEWGTLRLFENDAGTFREITNEVGLNRYFGWWQGVATGDFNGDGRLDIVASNIGLNTPWQLENDQPLRMYYSDLNNDGRTDIIESYSDGEGDYLPRLPLHRFQSEQISLNQMGSHAEFANATMTEILGEFNSHIPYKVINVMHHVVFLNTNNGFEIRPLPIETQLSAGFHTSVADFDNDGNEDLFISQNFFAVPQGQPRMDAGRGTVMLGNGNGSFTPLSGSESGIKVYGEQRGAAIGDFDMDGRSDIVVSQNGAETRLYTNRSENRGLRIRLNGPDSNKNGIGSSIRLVYEDGSKGPRRAIQAGSGYWSQNSATQVMGYSEQVDKIEVTWFDGNIQEADVEQDVMEYLITY